MKDAELKAIEARCNAATPGPWKHSTWTDQTGEVYSALDIDPFEHDNAAFIAAAREDVPKLADALRYARGQRDAAACTIRIHTDSWKFEQARLEGEAASVRAAAEMTAYENRALRAELLSVRQERALAVRERDELHAKVARAEILVAEVAATAKTFTRPAQAYAVAHRLSDAVEAYRGVAHEG